MKWLFPAVLSVLIKKKTWRSPLYGYEFTLREQVRGDAHHSYKSTSHCHCQCCLCSSAPWARGVPTPPAVYLLSSTPASCPSGHRHSVFWDVRR